ncbi:MAG: polyprenyl synthetase family protein [Desulfovibrio sp.]|nr:polyprenyl synthetase family protein [Desulfovibrio sp.]
MEAAEVERALAGCLDAWPLPAGLREAMEYSLLAGGKRLRPVLCLLFARLFGLGAAAAMPCALALECIHTYSLIHDDLPAMDNDDLRRGRPSSHRRFDEATAILAGDALLTDAFVLMAGTRGVPPERVLEAVRAVSAAAGSAGMVGGQFLDMRYTGKAGIGWEQLAAMQALKTGALLRASCLAGAMLAGADPEGIASARAYGEALGAAFQIADDILDATGAEERLGKPVGGDAAGGKPSCVAVLGLARSRHLARAGADAAIAALRGRAGETADLLRGLALYTVRRLE